MALSRWPVGRHLCDGFHLVPAGSDPGFADAIHAVVEVEGADCVLPQSSFDLEGLDEINVAALEDAQTWFDEFMTGIHTLKTLRARVPHLATIIEDTLARPDARTLRRS